jgi:hypothetical protein
MKKILLVMIFFICSLISVNANNVEKNIDEVIVNVPSYVYLYEGDSIEVGIRTLDKSLYEYIKYEIKGDKLYIDFNDYIFKDDIYLMEPKDIRINIQAPNNIKKIKTNSNLLVASLNKNINATNNGKN